MNAPAQAALPAGFEALEPFAATWALPTQGQRRARRLASRMQDIQAFYDSALPLMPRVAEHLNGFPLEALPASEQRLLWLAYAFMAVAPAVEIFKQPDVLGNTFDHRRFVEAHPISGQPLVAGG